MIPDERQDQHGGHRPGPRHLEGLGLQGPERQGRRLRRPPRQGQGDRRGDGLPPQQLGAGSEDRQAVQRRHPHLGKVHPRQGGVLFHRLRRNDPPFGRDSATRGSWRSSPTKTRTAASCRASTTKTRSTASSSSARCTAST
ncbi:MAG: hypothetical protein MZW92_02780 [Comamonadaceae bacterium]|nr:hypothetical protein [Comamonadaceae bacterium]